MMQSPPIWEGFFISAAPPAKERGLSAQESPYLFHMLYGKPDTLVYQFVSADIHLCGGLVNDPQPRRRQANGVLRQKHMHWPLPLL